MKGIGTISCSNVNHPTAECTQLTYTVKDIGNYNDGPPLAKEMDEVSGEIGSLEITVSDVDTEDEQTNMKWKLKDCAKEKGLHEIKKKVDLFLKRKGGQTTLDEA